MFRNKNKIDIICTNTDYTPYSIKREKHIKDLANKLKIETQIFHDILLFEPGTIKTSSNQYYQKFTPFYNTVIKNKVNEPVTLKNNNIKNCDTKYKITNNKMKTFYTSNPLCNVHGGRNNAIKIIDSITRFKTYEKTRNILKLETTQLSAYLKFRVRRY
jgi:deoxyribodipyrimidine photolyase